MSKKPWDKFKGRNMFFPSSGFPYTALPGKFNPAIASPDSFAPSYKRGKPWMNTPMPIIASCLFSSGECLNESGRALGMTSTCSPWAAPKSRFLPK